MEKQNWQYRRVQSLRETSPRVLSHRSPNPRRAPAPNKLVPQNNPAPVQKSPSRSNIQVATPGGTRWFIPTIQHRSREHQKLGQWSTWPPLT